MKNFLVNLLDPSRFGFGTYHMENIDNKANLKLEFLIKIKKTCQIAYLNKNTL